jgi:hypothetical protein
MGIGTGIFLLAVGAILRFAVTTTTKGLNIQTVGDILMIAGALGILLSLFFWNSWGGFGAGRTHTTTVVRDREVPVVRDREVY